jgi:ribosomal protein S18 acetylase RimI-like enzyme
MVTVRRATLDDCDQLGLVHVRAWQAAYRGCMPEGYLDGLRAENRSDLWRQTLTGPIKGHGLLVAERDERVVGFAAIGSSTEPGIGELHALNVDPDHWGGGVGRTLLTCAEQDFADSSYREAVLWVLPRNGRARGLYEQAGWRHDGAERTAEVLGVTVPEVRYRRELTDRQGRPPSRSTRAR